MSFRYISTAIFLLLLAGCKPAEQKSQVINNTVIIRVRTVELREYKIPVRTTGLLSTRTVMNLSFKTGGIIKQINVREGQSVARGHILAVLDLSEVRAKVNQARIGLEKSNRDLSRSRNLYNDSVATLEQYQNAMSAFELARSLKQVADFNLLHSQIIAPSGGTIQKIVAETNEMIAPGHPAILFASTENDWVVRSALTDKDIVILSLGDSAEITMDAFPGTVFRAVVTELGTIADPVTGTYEAELMIPHALPQFRSGFISRVQIYPSDTNRSMVVPIEALLDASDHAAIVYTFKDGEATKKRIRTGMILDDAIVVMEGLEEGEMVITEGARYLRKDSKVSLVN